MKLRIDEHTLPRYQTFGMVALVLILLVVAVGYLLVQDHFSNRVKREELREQIIQQQLERTGFELQTTLDYIIFRQSQTTTELKQQARSQVEQALALANTIYERERDRRSVDEIKVLLREAFRQLRFFSGRGYLIILDRQGNSILNTFNPDLEGDSIRDIKDDRGFYIVREIIQRVNESPDGAGYLRYRWYTPNSEVMSEKLSYFKLFEPLGWIIGTGDYLHQFEIDIQATVLKRIDALRFGGKGYIAVISDQGDVISSPGWSISQFAESSAQAEALEEQAISAIVRTGRNGGGVVRYHWYYPDGRGPVEKISRVVPVPEWGWYLVSGVYPEDVDAGLAQQQNELQELQTQKNNTLVTVLGVAAIFSLLLALWFSKGLRRLFRIYQADIKKKQKRLADNARELEVAARVFQNSSEGIMITDADNRIEAVNDAFCVITGYQPDEVIGKNPSILGAKRHDATFYAEMWATLSEEGRWQGELWNRRKDGSLYPQWLSVTVCRDENDRIDHFIGTLMDISERKEAERKMRYLSEYDPLTDLPNRRLLHQRLARALQIAGRHAGRQVALLLVDLDRFKNINDSLGHAAGDRVLQQMAMRLTTLAGVGDTVSRMGGDEFAVLLSGTHLPEAAAQLAERIQEKLVEPVMISGRQLVLTPSIGIAVYPGDGLDIETLIRNADAALYHAKDAGRNAYQFYTEQMNQLVSQRLDIENGLRQALEQKGFELHYQPQYRLSDGSLYGCEALIRLTLADGQIWRPDQFIPVAEETGLIEPIGRWVLETACHQGARWLEMRGEPLNMAVNLSPNQFGNSLVSIVRDTLQASNFPANMLTLEITETVLMRNPGQAAEILKQLKGLGVGLALDDFGTGYSSLSYLKTFPLDKLKIDRAFIDGLPDDQDDSAITSSIIDIARNLGLDTVAEGIENADQEQHLVSEGCDLVQGYFYARPMAADQFEALVTEADWELSAVDE